MTSRAIVADGIVFMSACRGASEVPTAAVPAPPAAPVRPALIVTTTKPGHSVDPPARRLGVRIHDRRRRRSVGPGRAAGAGCLARGPRGRVLPRQRPLPAGRLRGGAAGQRRHALRPPTRSILRSGSSRGSARSRPVPPGRDRSACTWSGRTRSIRTDASSTRAAAPHRIDGYELDPRRAPSCGRSRARPSPGPLRSPPATSRSRLGPLRLGAGPSRTTARADSRAGLRRRPADRGPANTSAYDGLRPLLRPRPRRARRPPISSTGRTRVRLLHLAPLRRRCRGRAGRDGSGGATTTPAAWPGALGPLPAVRLRLEWPRPARARGRRRRGAHADRHSRLADLGRAPRCCRSTTSSTSAESAASPS